MVGFGSYKAAVDALAGWMKDRQHVCGDRFTMADVYVGSQVDWGVQFGTLPEIDVFQAYAARLREREAYQRAKAIDQELMPEQATD
jgi:glutathione S-transferase